MPVLEQTIAVIDAANSADPNQVQWDGKPEPKELVYGRKMSAWLAKLKPDASEALKLAARAQHICRWELPRDRYPAGRVGYLQWRGAQYAHHATRVGKILQEAGYDGATIAHVQRLVRKLSLKKDIETQTLEDVACLVFFEFELPEFMQHQPKEKMLEILRKTWKKMSADGQVALKALLPGLSAAEQNLIQQAVAQASGPC